ncbi:hypothetical protein NV379_23350 [Paenibacillus sp. N1-5-1-14]|nr:hypothetical protein [Paenibacillus radicibacter]MCR8645579.1 hypothetical protein [Paenibacillus radicibacter]
MRRRKKKRRMEQELPKQPALCLRCVWGQWTGVKQYCPKQICVKADTANL